jgi:hypothetical protein
VDDAEEEQQDDDQPRHAEDPQQKRNHRRLLSAGSLRLDRSQARPSSSAAHETHLAEVSSAHNSRCRFPRLIGRPNRGLAAP